MKNLILLIVFTLMTLFAFSQKSSGRWEAYLTIHNNNYKADFHQYKSQIGLGIGVKMRLKKEIKYVSSFVGLGFEQWPIQRYYEVEDLYYDMNWSAISIPIGVNIGGSGPIHISPFVSLDALLIETIQFPGEPKRSNMEIGASSFTLSAGTDLTFSIPINDDQSVVLGGRFKYNTIVALRDHDFWPLGDDERPFYYGVILGYRF